MSGLDTDLYGVIDLYGDTYGERRRRWERHQQQQQQHTQPVRTSYTQPAPQKIPTYEQPQPSEYGEPPVTHTDGGTKISLSLNGATYCCAPFVLAGRPLIFDSSVSSASSTSRLGYLDTTLLCTPNTQ
ncbi:hypothetical protein K443DRAFT_12192 [Laccaria amethystina LaAM-08-1]|uniref:Uncharacterized protein n=1 Tax=Laccaria amethystina LaAM-08-1 TaxID=1095629 RepID=A0A0C9X9H4_9AGAR|nr:hypothetical protein K443DRAFT_12192 [Laccaria amethystina LaAM-08-1]